VYWDLGSESWVVGMENDSDIIDKALQKGLELLLDQVNKDEISLDFLMPAYGNVDPFYVLLESRIEKTFDIAITRMTRQLEESKTYKNPYKKLLEITGEHYYITKSLAIAFADLSMRRQGICDDFYYRRIKGHKRIMKTILDDIYNTLIERCREYEGG